LPKASEVAVPTLDSAQAIDDSPNFRPSILRWLHHRTDSPVDSILQRLSLPSLLRNVLLVLIASGLLILADWIDLFEKPEFLARDWLFRMREIIDRDHEFDPRVKVVGITDADLSVIGRWPWPRVFHGEMVSLLTLAEADVIAFDLLFVEPDIDEESDKHFAVAATESDGRVVVGAEKINRDGLGTNDLSDPLTRITGKLPDHERTTESSALLPYPALRDAVNIGFVNADADSDGGRRELPLVEYLNGNFYPSLATRTLMTYWQLNAHEVEVALGDSVTFHTKDGKRVVPIDDEGKMIVNLRSPARYLKEGVVSYVKLYQALESHLIEDQPWDNSSALHPAGRVFVFGQVAPGLSDMGPTAFQPLTPLCYLQAQAIGNILQSDFVWKAPFLRSLSVWALVVLLLRLTQKRHSLRASLATPLLVITVYVLIATLLFSFHSVLLPLVWPIGGYAAFQFATVVRSWQSERDARIATDASLQAAAEIQLSTLPNTNELGDHDDKFELAAQLIPAQDASGDFYDFFMIDESHLCLVVADVCDKGITAATFMLQAKTLLKAVAHEAGRSGIQSSTPAAIFAQANRELSERNARCMFATAILGIYDTESGQLDYCTAGHHPPILRSKDGRISELPGTGDLALGLIQDVDYHTHTYPTNPGDAIIAYTDGISEAFNHQGAMYGLDRLLRQLERSDEESAAALLSSLIENLRQFTQRAEQSDDITALVLRRSEELTTNTQE
ncbi:MAG: SpoIIE family protein phosphatase, partial [Verrucomicrobiota bacterium]